MPERIQLRRTKGWRLPPNTVVVARPTKWGNPYNWQEGVEIGGEAWAKGAAVDLFKELITRPAKDDPRKPPTVEEVREQLRGKNLACWCKPNEPCHADVLLRLANY